MSARLGNIEHLRALWQGETSSASARACLALMAAGIIAAMLVGRAGYAWSRAAALAILIVAAVPSIGRAMLHRRRERDPRAVMRATIQRTEPQIARAALRALDLTDDTRADPRRGSIELAHHHLARVLGRASLDDVEAHAGRAATRTTVLALAAAAAALGLTLVDPFRIVEGVDVLLARDGVAPLAVDWVELPRVTAEPPAYLDMSRAPLRPHHPSAVHVGTVVSINALPLRSGRALVLTDGSSEVPFHEDGDGAMVARWTVVGDVSLSIAARFGDVIVPEPIPLELSAIVDHAPFVQLEGAPATIRLLDQPSIPIHWQVSDDHGLREVVLVLRAGEREERRVLSKQQGQSAHDRGGIELRASDPFLDKSYLPIEVTIQALDNDPVSGPKWGTSAAIIVVPPQIAEREAMRYRALRAGRDAVTDLLAARIEAPPPKPTERAALLARERAWHTQAGVVIRSALSDDYGGIALRGRIAALIRGQVERLHDGVEALGNGALPPSHVGLITTTENALLAIDSALGFLGTRDTRDSALKMSEVATDAARAISESRDPAARDRATRRLAADLDALAGSAEHLLQLGSLGRDLGEIVQNGLRRIHRAWDVGDRYHARLAAEDLAARLRQPDPSFGSAGGQSHGGVESGEGGQQSDGEASQAAEQLEDVDHALEQLRREHAEQMGEVEQALRDAMSPEQKQALEEQMRQAAKEVRDAVESLPEQASEPNSARGNAAAARSEAESAAAAMERGDLSQAVEQGMKAIASLERAQKQGGEAPNGSSDRSIGEAAGDARDKLRDVMERAERAREEMQDHANDNARDKLEGAAKREQQLAERARELRKQSEDSEAPLPQQNLERLREAAEAMDRAARSLERGRGHKGQAEQREAQRLLEMAQPEQEQEPSKSNDGDGKDFARDADVPPENRDERADAFRKRVTEGLGRKAPPHLREALRRYTEGLLR